MSHLACRGPTVNTCLSAGRDSVSVLYGKLGLVLGFLGGGGGILLHQSLPHVHVSRYTIKWVFCKNKSRQS